MQVNPSASFVLISVAAFLVVATGGVVLAGMGGVTSLQPKKLELATSANVGHCAATESAAGKSKLGASVEGNDDNTVLENMWIAWKFLNDPSAHTDEQGYTIRAVSCVISILGILIMSILMGFIVDVISMKMEELRKGKSKQPQP